jgi:hypothetical protein
MRPQSLKEGELTTAMKPIVESLTRQGKKIRSALDARWEVVANVCHVRDLSARTTGFHYPRHGPDDP